MRSFRGGDGQTDGRLEIHPCVLQDIGPLGPLPKKERKRERERKKDEKKERKKEREKEKE